MNSLPSSMQEHFHKVRPFVIHHPVFGRQPLSGAEPAGNEARDYLDAYGGLDTIHEDAFLFRYPPLNSGVDSRFHVAIDQEGALWGVLVRRLCDHRNRAIFPRNGDRKSTKNDGVVAVARLRKDPDINRVPKFLREEVANLDSTNFFAPRAVLYSENWLGDPKKAYFVVPLHGRTLLDAAPLLVKELVLNSRAATPEAKQRDAHRIFARNLCYDVWFNLRELQRSELCHFDLKLDNFFVKMDSSRGLRCAAGNVLPPTSSAGDGSCVFVLGDYGHSVRAGNAAELRERTVAPAFGQVGAGTPCHKRLLGTYELCHPDVFEFFGELYDGSLHDLLQVPRFAVSHNIDRFSAGLMLAKTLQTFRATADSRQVEDPWLFNKLKFEADQGMPALEQRDLDAGTLKRQIYRSNAAVFRRVVRGEPLPTGSAAEVAYAEGWTRFFRELGHFDAQVSQMVFDLLYLAQNSGEDLEGPQPNETEPFFELEPEERAAFRQSVAHIGTFDAATASHITSLLQHRQELFAMAHEERQRLLAGRTR